jgi:hypothetical protein
MKGRHRYKKGMKRAVGDRKSGRSNLEEEETSRAAHL